MNLRKSIGIALAISLVTSALACGSDTEQQAGTGESPGESAERADDGSPRENTQALAPTGLTLTEVGAERVQGRYVSAVGKGVGLVFNSSKTGEGVLLSLSDLKGRELVHLEGSPKQGSFCVMARSRCAWLRRWSKARPLRPRAKESLRPLPNSPPPGNRRSLMCAQHDRWCGRCGWTHPHDCLLCYGPTAVIGLLGC
jgi:hypothetical protein